MYSPEYPLFSQAQNASQKHVESVGTEQVPYSLVQYSTGQKDFVIYSSRKAL
jgi:hypothetical protein